jgi:hypothetical protein
VRKIVLVQKVLNSKNPSTVIAVARIFKLDANNPYFSSELAFMLNHERHIDVYNDEIHNYAVKEGKQRLHTLQSFDLRTCITTGYPRGREGRAKVIRPMDAMHNLNIKSDPNKLFDKLGYSCFNVNIEFELKENAEQPHTIHKIHLIVTSSLGIPCNPVLNLSNRLIDYFPVEMNREINFGGEIINIRTQLLKVENVL